MTREAAVLITLVIYKLVLVGIGLYYGRSNADETDYYLGGRRLGPLVAAISASASSSSAWTLLGVSGAAYAWGLSALWLFPSCVGGFLLNWFLLAPALRRISREENAVTVTEVLAGPPGTPRRRVMIWTCSLIILLSLGTYVASQFQGAGKAFNETFGLSLTSSILIGSLIVVAYTWLGGFWAVSVTDTLQGILMAATAIVLPVSALLAVGGPAGLVEGLAALPETHYLSLTRNLGPVAALGFILGLLGIGLGYPGQPHVVNRFMALRSVPRALHRARTYAVVWACVVYSGMLLLGFCGRLLLPGLADREVVFISLTNQLFPPVISGIMLAAVLSAIMSTADSQLLVASSSVSRDLGVGEKWSLSRLGLSRATVLVVSGGAIVGALLGTREIFSQVLFAWAAMGSAFGPLLLVTVMKGRVRPSYGLASVAVGFSASVLAFYLFPVTLEWKGFFERMAPFFLALGIAVWGRARRPAG